MFAASPQRSHPRAHYLPVAANPRNGFTTTVRGHDAEDPEPHARSDRDLARCLQQPRGVHPRHRARPARRRNLHTYADNNLRSSRWWWSLGGRELSQQHVILRDKRRGPGLRVRNLPHSPRFAAAQTVWPSVRKELDVRPVAAGRGGAAGRRHPNRRK